MKICFFTDTHIIDRNSIFNNNLETVIEFIDNGNFDFAFHLGDVAADGASDPSQLSFAAQCHAALRTPVHYVPGNHDIGDNPVEGGHSSERLLNLDRLAEFRQLFGSDRWSVEGDGWQIIGLNSQLFASGSDAEAEQFAWLQEVLDNGSGRLGLALHKPLIRHEDTVGPAVRYVPEAERDRLLDLCAKRDLKFVASGHVHQQRRFTLNDVEHVWVPSTSFCIPEAMQARVGEKVVGVTTLELGSDGTFRFTAQSIEGLVRHNLLDHPEIYPVAIPAIRERLGAAAALED